MSLGVTIQGINLDPDRGQVLVKTNITAGAFGAYLYAKDNCDPVQVGTSGLASLISQEVAAFVAVNAQLANSTVKVLDLPDQPSVVFGANPLANPGYGQTSITATVSITTVVVVMQTDKLMARSMVTNPNFPQYVAGLIAQQYKQLAGAMTGFIGSY